MVTFGIVQVTAVRVVRDETLSLRFSDGFEGEVDLSPVLRGPMLAPLRDPLRFAEVRVAHGTIEWPNGVDLDPAVLRRLASKGYEAQSDDDGEFGLAWHAASVPEISRFFGIVIRMFFNDHARPHFHAQFGDSSIAIEIDGDGVRGSFPPHRLHLLFEWRDAHKAELRDNWERLRRDEPALPIPPLE